MQASLKRLLRSPFVIVVVALLLRLAILYVTWHRAAPADFTGPYGYETGSVAMSIALGHGFSSPLSMVRTGPTAWFSPIYPYLIAGIFKLWGIYSFKSHIVIQAINCLFASLIVFPIYAIAKRSFGTAIATAASWLWVVLPTAWYVPLQEIFGSTLAALCLALVFWASLFLGTGRRGPQCWIAYGVLWSISGLVNPALLAIFPFFLVWLIWALRKQSEDWTRPIACTVLVFVLGLLPWTVRNYRAFGKFVPLRSNFGLELWLGNNPQAADVNSFSMHPYDSPVERDAYKRMGEISYMRAKQEQAFAFMRSHPAVTLYFIARRIGSNWFSVSDRVGSVFSTGTSYLKLYFFFNAAMILLAWLGLWFAWRTRNAYRLPYLFVLLIYPLVFYITHTLVRYRFPIDPLLTILAIYGLACASGLAFGRQFPQLRPDALIQTRQ